MTTPKVDRWRIYWRKLCQEVPKNFLIYLKFDTTETEIDEAFVNRNVMWLNKIGYFNFENLWSHQLILNSLLSIKDQVPDLVNYNKLISFAAANVDQMFPSKKIFKLITENDQKYLEKEKSIEEILPEYLLKEEEETKDLDKKAKETQIQLEFELKQTPQKDEVEQIDTGTIKDKDQVVEDIISRILGENHEDELENLKDKEMDLLYEVINLEKDEVMDLKGLISDQTNSINRVMKVLTQNWKEILNKIKDYYVENPIPSEMYQDDVVFVPKEGPGKHFKDEYDYLNFSIKKRGRSPELKRGKKVRWNFREEEEEESPETRENRLEYEKNWRKVQKDREKYMTDEFATVKETELKNWIKNMNYQKIQENIDAGRIRRWN